ncbi:MAG: hypothetical protein OEX22_11960, partial [Cyclobacteriaceae bacterium]|nr:hypothetical protein [Cyclobacteriaceae bacterium]
MSKKIVILVLPGIGTKEKEFSKAFQADVHKFSKGTPLANNTIVVEGLPFKESQVDKNQSALFDRIDKISKLGGPLSPRKFVLAAFGDGVTFERDS